MKKLWILSGILALCLPGCGSDEREQLINKSIDQLNNAASNMATIKENIVKWEKGKENEKSKLLDIAEKSTVELQKSAKKLQEIKQQADKLEAPAPEDRKAFVDKFRDRYASAIEKVEKERIALNEVIARADKNHKGSLATLKSKLQQIQGDFENLVKPH